MEQLGDLSQFKFDSEGDKSITEHASLFLKFCEYYETGYEDVSCIIFYLTLEGWVSRWCHTLPPATIHSFKHLITELPLAFDMYDYLDVLKGINQLRINYNESIEDLSD